MNKKDDYVIADTVFGYPVQFLKLFRNIGLYTIARDLLFFLTADNRVIMRAKLRQCKSTREEREEIVQVALFYAFLPGIYLCLQRCNEYLPER